MAGTGGARLQAPLLAGSPRPHTLLSPGTGTPVPLWGTWVQTSWDDALAAEEQEKKAAALPAPGEHLPSVGHRWVLEPALPLQQGQAELSALVGAQSMLQTSAKTLQGCPRCGVQPASAQQA